jgi:hypothetical protein
MRWVLGGDRFWWQNMGWNGEVGDQGLSLALMGWAFGNTFVWVGRFLGATAVLSQVRAPGFIFGRTLGVGIELLKTLFLCYIPLPAIKGRLLRITWSSLEDPSNGTPIFQVVS